MLANKYLTSKEIMYDTNVNILLSPHEYKAFLDYKSTILKSGNKFMTPLDLKSFNDQPLFFSLSNDLVSIEESYVDLVIEDIKTNEKTLFVRNFDDITLSRIYSEIEGTLNIEHVPTTRKIVSELVKEKRDPQNLNEQIIKNMWEGIGFVHNCPEFNEENLFKLYSILSKGCLDDEDKLLEGNIYRHDGVDVDNYQGCPVELIKPCMDSLFEFFKKNKDDSTIRVLLPHIAHYYIAYIHPYFDYNGRTARMVSYWISILTNKTGIPPTSSEGINQTKNDYYSSLRETRNAYNDLTYFLTYIFDVSVRYFLTYKNIEEIDQKLKNNGIVLTNNEKMYFKKILISNKGKFLHQDFCTWIGVEMSKQGALKVLNALESYGLLKSETTPSNKKLFFVNDEILRYRFRKD